MELLEVGDGHILNGYLLRVDLFKNLNKDEVKEVVRKIEKHNGIEYIKMSGKHSPIFFVENTAYPPNKKHFPIYNTLTNFYGKEELYNKLLIKIKNN